jgi:hypothetical protein
LVWSSDGKRVLAGDAAGKLYLVEIAPEIATSRSEDLHHFEESLIDLENRFKELNSDNITTDDIVL